MVEIGEIAPEFTLPSSGGGTITLTALRPKPVVLYFYPKDDTPGCTTEALEFTAEAAAFRSLGAVVLGISKDSIARHEKFIAKHDLDIMLLADESGEVCQAYGTWVEKNMYGRKYFGIQRATFLIGADGRVAHLWPKVKAKGHARQVLDVLSGMNTSPEA